MRRAEIAIGVAWIGMALAGCGRDKAPIAAPAKHVTPTATPQSGKQTAAEQGKGIGAEPTKTVVMKPSPDKQAAIKAARARAEAMQRERDKPLQIGGVTIVKQKQGAWALRILPGAPSAPTTIAPDRARPKTPIDDNADFPAFLRYLAPWQRRPEAAGQFKFLKVADRRSVLVRDVKGVPVPMAVVDIAQDGQAVWRARSYGDGQLYFYPAMTKAKPGLPWSLSTVALVSRGRGVLPAQATSATIDLAGTQSRTILQFDVALVIDTTASMAAAMPAIRRAILSALKRFDALGVKVDFRVGAVAYRDVGEAYLTAMLPMTTVLTQFLQELGTLKGEGGGDAADALDQGFYVATDKLTWRRTSAKAVFIITDAPPKPALAGDQDHTVSAIRAAARGIRVHTLALAGHDAKATLAFRQISQMACGLFFPLPAATSPKLEQALADAMFGRLQAELVGWTNPPK